MQINITLYFDFSKQLENFYSSIVEQPQTLPQKHVFQYIIFV